VLLVDDDALAGKLLQLAMQKRGNIEVLWAWKLSEASSLLAGLKPGSAVDFVVTDLNLGAESGLDVIRMVRAHALVGKVPVFLMSASEGHDAAAAAAGANAFVSKRELVTNINAWMQRVLDEYFPSRAAA
jgi:DNA-binding response OmpR family regulator